MEQFERLALALAIGFLVGVERGWRARDVAEGGRTAGIRTYALSGLLGGIAGVLAQSLGGWAFAAIAIPFATAFVLFKQREQEAEHDHSVTAIVAALLVFTLGAYAMVGDWRLAAAAAVVATALLAFKSVLHTWLKRLTWPELRGALVLLAMSFVALPLLPDQDFGPYGAVNPHELWLLTIVLTGVSFAAYAAIRIYGPTKGVVLGALVGALISSTAVTLDVARRSKAGQVGAATGAGAALLAGAVMAGRIALVAGVLAPVLLERLAAPLGAFAAVSVAVAFALVRRGGGAPGPSAEPPMTSPLDLKAVFRFALILGAVMAAARVLSALFGSGALIPLAAGAGLADVDAVTLTVGQMAAKGLDLHLGAWAILTAGLADSLSKSAIAALAGGRRFGAPFVLGTLAAITAAGAALWIER